MSLVEPSEYVPVAVNAWVEPTAKLAGEAGATAIEDNVAEDVVVEAVDAAATTVKLTGGLVTPDRAAVILAVPAATPVAKPVESIVAVPVVSLAQVT